MKALPSASTAPIDVTPLDEPGDEKQYDTRGITRLGLIVIGIAFGGFLLWAAIAPLDEGVPNSAMVSVDTKRKTVQHLTGGIVREILVREGQMVRANDVVIRLDDAISRANFEATRQRYYGLRANEGRLVAEQLGLATVSYHPALVEAAKQDPIIREHLTVQNQLLQSRRASLAANLGAIAQSIQGQEALIVGYRAVLASRDTQMASLEREVKGMRDLVAEGYAPWNKQLELERSQSDIAASSADLQAKIASAQSAMLELRQRAEVARADYRKEVDSNLSDVRRDVQSEAEKFKALTEDLARTEIRASASGQVVGLGVQTVGAVVQAGQKLMDIVPQDETLLLEAKIAPFLIDRVRIGGPVDVRFSAFAHSPQLVVQGTVVSIASDILTDPNASTPVPYYLARVAITPEGMKELGKRQLQAGMPAEVVIKTGERSMLTYLLHPMLKRMSAAMKEE